MKIGPLASATLAVAVSLAAPAAAQTLPAGVINAPPTVIGPNQSIGSNTTLNVGAFGAVGDAFDAGLFNGTSTNVAVNVTGGRVGDAFDAFAGSTVTVSGGEFVGAFDANAGSDVAISGGLFGELFEAKAGSTVAIRGGRFGDRFAAAPGSAVELIGGDFRLNGAPAGPTVTLGPTDVLTGALEDGSPFVFGPAAFDALNGVTLTTTALPPIDTTPVVVEAQLFPPPTGLRPGQTLTLQAGGVLPPSFAVVDATLNIEGGAVSVGLETAGSAVEISGGQVGDGFNAFAGSVVNVTGGVVGRNFRVLDGATVNISAGSVSAFLAAARGSTVNISGGSIAADFSALDGSTVNISGGEVSAGFDAVGGSTVNITGGDVDLFRVFSGATVNIDGGLVGGFRAFDGSVINVGGGAVGNDFRAQAGSTVNYRGGAFGDRFAALTGSAVEIVGSEFFLDGVLVDFGVAESVVVLDRDVQLTGRLADGTLFDFNLLSTAVGGQDFFAPGATLTLTLVPEPSSLALFAAAAVAVGARRRV